MKQNKIHKLFYIAVFALLLASLFIWYALAGKPSPIGLIRDGSYGAQMDLDTSFAYAAQKYNGGVAVLGKSGLVGITNSGRKAYEIDFAATNPILSCAGRYVLSADQGGTRLLLTTGGKIRQDMELDGKLITAAVNKKGAFVVVTEERGYKGCVRVYTAGGKELYAWHSAEQNILAAALSDDTKKLAVSVVNMTDLSRMCSVYQFDFQETTPRKCDVGDENLVANLVYNGKELVAIGDEALYAFKDNGEPRFKLDYEGRELQKYSFYPGGILAMGFWGGQDGGSSSVEFYDGNGNLKGSCPVNGAISAMDTFGKYAVISTNHQLMVIAQNGKIKAEEPLDTGAQRVFLCGSRSRVFLLTGNSAGMYIL